MVSQWNHAILTDALPTSSICNPAQKSSGQIKINNLPLECRAKAPADRGKSVNGGGVISKMMCRCGNGGRSGNPFSRESLCIAAQPSQALTRQLPRRGSLTPSVKTRRFCQLPLGGSLWHSGKVSGNRDDGEESGRCRIFRWIYFTQRTFFAGFYPLALKKYTLFFYLRVVYA